MVKDFPPYVPINCDFRMVQIPAYSSVSLFDLVGKRRDVMQNENASFELV